MEHALSLGMQACLLQRERKGNPKKKKREEKNKRQGTSLGGCM
jgi:hypothetical protein